MIEHYLRFSVMTMSLVLSLFLLVVLVNVDGAVITVSPPQLVTVSPFAMTKFEYEGIGNELNLLIQGAPLTPAIQQQRGISFTDPGIGPGNLSSVLSIVGLPDNDGIGINCQILSYPPFEQAFSLGTTLKIKGVSPVEDLIHNFLTDTSLLITWSPPVYYSNDVSIESFVSYQVLVIDEEDGDIILDTNTLNINITVYNITECDTFNISVTAILDQYISIDNTRSINGSYSIAEYDTHPLIPSIFFELGCPPSRCLVSLMDGSTEVTDIINETQHIIGFKLLPFRHYELTAVVKNLRGKIRATYSTLISTFHTHDIIISSPYTNGSLTVQCVFVSGSTADGCHVIFTDTDRRIIEFFNITGSSSTIVTLSASGVYDVYVYDIVNGSLYGPAVQVTTLVEIVEVIPPIYTSSSILSESTTCTATTQFTVANTVSSTTTSITVTGTTSSTSKTTNDNDIIVPTVAGTVCVCIVLMILTILTLCAVITVNKRKRMNGVFIRSEFATTQKSQAETNQYQDVHELINEVSNTTSPVLLTSGRLIIEEDPYHVTRSEFLTVNHTIPSHSAIDQLVSSQEPRPSLTSMATQDTTLGNSISSTTSNNIHDNAYTTDPPVTVSVSNDTNTADTVAVTDTVAPATVALTYASIAKRTDTLAIPTVDQRVTYDKVTRDINKRGEVTLYLDNANNIVPGDINSTTSEDEAADLSDSPPSYDDLDTTTDPVIEHGSNSTESMTGTPQAAPNDYFYSQAEEVSQINGATTLCVSPPAEQPKDDHDHSSSRCCKYLFDNNNGSTPLLLPLAFFNHNIATTQDEEETHLYHVTMPLENLDDEESGHSGVMIVPRDAYQDLQQLEVEEEINNQAAVSSFDKEENHIKLIDLWSCQFEDLIDGIRDIVHYVTIIDEPYTSIIKATFVEFDEVMELPQEKHNNDVLTAFCYGINIGIPLALQSYVIERNENKKDQVVPEVVINRQQDDKAVSTINRTKFQNVKMSSTGCIKNQCQNFS